MKTLLEHEPAGDARLVELCLGGNRNAFGQIVARYQSLVCSIAYSACGDIGRSEDLAQDTFVSAWKNMAGLKEPEKLKSWLCGIARNLVNNSMRAQQRVPTARADELPPETRSPEANPQEMAISNEEEALMWRALETIPETYREPMILFYRENQSTPAVAAALEISEEAARQRLTRGRAMLAGRMAKTVELALLKSAPGREFTLAVVAALPGITMSAKAAAIGTTAAKGGAAAKGAGLLGLFYAVLGPVMAVLAPYINYKIEMGDNSSPAERRFIRRFFGIMVAGMALFTAAMLALCFFAKPLVHSHPAIYTGLWIGLAAGYVIFGATLIFWSSLTRRAKRRAQMMAGTPREPVFEYRSKFTLLGLPLVHIRMRAGLERGPVKAWFAAGDAAIGVIFAFGAAAIAPFSIGGIAIGLVPFGGFSFGPWAIGVFAVGWQASGFCAVSWLAADGGIAVARHFAQGEMVSFAVHANDAAAASFFKHSAFFQNVHAVMHSNWLNLFWFYPLVLWWQVARKKRRAKITPGA